MLGGDTSPDRKGAIVSIQDLVTETLRSPEPAWELRGVVRALLAQGYDRASLLDALLECQGHFQETGQEREEDVLIGLMDSLTGWSAPSWQL